VLLLSLMLSASTWAASGPGGNGRDRDVRRGRGNRQGQPGQGNPSGLPGPRPAFTPRVGLTPTEASLSLPISVSGTDDESSSGDLFKAVPPPTDPVDGATASPFVETPRGERFESEVIVVEEAPKSAAAASATPPPEPPPASQRVEPFPQMEEPPIRIVGDLKTDVGRFTADSYPPALRAFLIALVGSANLIPKTDTIDFDYLEQAVKLSIIMKYLVAVYGDPIPYTGPPIKDLATYKALTDPTDGLRGTVTGNYQALLEQAIRWDRSDGKDLRRAYRVDLPKDGRGSFETQMLNQAARYIDDVRAKNMLGVVVTGAASLGAEMATTEVQNQPLTIVETLATGLGQFLVNMTRSPGNVADMMRALANILENRNNFGTRTVPTDAALPQRVSERLREAATQVDNLASWGTDQTAFLTFLGQFANADTMKIKDIIQAFEAALVPAIEALRKIGSRVTRMQEFQLIAERDQKLLKHLKEIFNFYPEVLSERQLREILWSLIQNPTQKSDMSALELVLKKAGPMLLNVVQHAADQGGNSPLASMFKQFQGNNTGVPTEVIVAQILADPAHFPIVEIGRTPLGTGKFYQFHGVRLQDGRIRGLRAQLPGALEALREEYGILTNNYALGRLSDIIVPGNGSRDRKMRTARLLLDAEFGDLMLELDVLETVTNQTLADVHLTKTLPFRENGKNAVLEIRVPDADPTVKGSTMMLVQLIEEPIDVDVYRLDHPEAARQMGGALLQQFFDGLVINPLEATKSGTPDAEGFGHRDLHSKNILLVKPQVIDGVTHYIVYLTDFGLAARLSPQEAENLMLLAVGANLNNARFITDALWTLSLESDGDEATRAQRYRDTYTIVSKTVTELRRRKTFFSVGDWITRMYTQGYLNFDPTLPSLSRGQVAVQGLFTSMGHTNEELDAFTSRYFDGKRGMAVGMARSQYPMVSSSFPFLHPRNAASWAGAVGSYASYSVGQCAERIARAMSNKPGRVSPLEAMSID